MREVYKDRKMSISFVVSIICLPHLFIYRILFTRRCKFEQETYNGKVV